MQKSYIDLNYRHDYNGRPALIIDNTKKLLCIHPDYCWSRKHYGRIYEYFELNDNFKIDPAGINALVFDTCSIYLLDNFSEFQSFRERINNDDHSEFTIDAYGTKFSVTWEVEGNLWSKFYICRKSLVHQGKDYEGSRLIARRICRLDKIKLNY
jgi:hypothetical protein